MLLKNLEITINYHNVFTALISKLHICAQWWTSELQRLLSITCLICQFSIWSQKELIHNKKTDVWCLPAFESSLFAAITTFMSPQVLKTSICVSVSSNGRRTITCQALEMLVLYTPSRKPVCFFSRNTYQTAWNEPCEQKAAHLSPWWAPTIAENRPFSSESTSACVTVIDRERWKE